MSSINQTNGYTIIQERENDFDTNNDDDKSISSVLSESSNEDENDTENDNKNDNKNDNENDNENDNNINKLNENLKYLKIVELDCKNIRKERQKLNNLLVFEDIKSNNINSLNNNINNEQLKRVLEELNISKKELIKLCQENEIMNKILSSCIAKNASRQGTKDEELILKTCNIISSKFGINIENLPAKTYRPTKCGKILKINTRKTYEYLKSFDGKITGKMNGWIFAKVCIGSGGHQDNVLEEVYIFCKWVKKYKSFYKKDIFIVLFDTNLDISEIKNKYSNISQLLILNHIEFQKYIIDNYSVCSK
jgi:hypothetical protein